MSVLEDGPLYIFTDPAIKSLILANNNDNKLLDEILKVLKIC